MELYYYNKKREIIDSWSGRPWKRPTRLGAFDTLDALYRAAREHLKENKDRDKDGYSWVKTGKVIL